MIAMNAFFKTGNIPNRHRINVYRRTAFTNAFKDVSKVVDLARVLDMNHSSVVHYKRTHESLIMYEDYRELYHLALSLKNNIMEDDTELETFWSKERHIQQMNDLKIQIDYLKGQINKLSMYKDKYEKIVEALNK